MALSATPHRTHYALPTQHRTLSPFPLLGAPEMTALLIFSAACMAVGLTLALYAILNPVTTRGTP